MISDNSPTMVSGNDPTMISDKSLLVLSQLRQNCREHSKKIARKTCLSPSTVSSKIEEMERKNIVRHTSLIDFRKTGYPVHAVVCFRGAGEKLKEERLKEFITGHRQLNTLLSVAVLPDSTLGGEAEKEKAEKTSKTPPPYYAEAGFRSITELADFVEQLEDAGATGIKEHYIIEELKKEDFLAGGKKEGKTGEEKKEKKE